MSFQVKFHHLRAFVEVARQGSIRGASRTLNLSQPALTKSIKELEEGMAAQLESLREIYIIKYILKKQDLPDIRQTL